MPCDWSFSGALADGDVDISCPKVDNKAILIPKVDNKAILILILILIPRKDTLIYFSLAICQILDKSNLTQPFFMHEQQGGCKTVLRPRQNCSACFLYHNNATTFHLFSKGYSCHEKLSPLLVTFGLISFAPLLVHFTPPLPCTLGGCLVCFGRTGHGEKFGV